MTKVKLDQVVNRIAGNVDYHDPQFTYYLGGEHYKSNSIEIVDRGVIKGTDLGPNYHYPFKKNDTIFMARNPHLHKAGRIAYDGVCSHASFVLRTKNETVLLSDFLPIIMQSESLWDFFNENKSGSVNSHCNWSSLKNFEFSLPDIDAQKQYCHVIWTLQEYIVKTEEQLYLWDELVKSRFIEMFKPYFDLERCVPLESLCNTFVDGDWIESKDQDTSGIRLIQTGNVGISTYLDKADKARFINEETFERLNCTEVLPGDILISRLPDPIARSCIVPEGLGKSITGVDCTIVRFKDTVNPIFFNQYTLIDHYLSQISAFEAGSTRKRISRKNLGKIKVPLPSIDLQNQFAAFVEQVDKSKFELQKHLEDTKKLQKALINQAFKQ